jgi:hypothetical protein
MAKITKNPSEEIPSVYIIIFIPDKNSALQYRMFKKFDVLQQKGD